MKNESVSEPLETAGGYMIRPRVLLANGLRRETSADLYNDIAGRLRARGIEVEIIHAMDGAGQTFQGYDLLISNVVVPASMQAGMSTYAGRRVSRPTSLRLLAEFDVPTMEWSLARTRREVRALFDAWSTERVLLKPSFTYGGKGVRVFTRNAVWRLRWKRDVDVFCPEINPDDGDVYKAELLNGRVLISWKSAAPPIRMLFRHGLHRGIRGAYGERSLWELPSELTAKLEALSRRLTFEGMSHVSVDLMRRADGELIAIELNTGSVATWWTRQFSHFRNQYAEALFELAVQHGTKREFYSTGG